MDVPLTVATVSAAGPDPAGAVAAFGWHAARLAAVTEKRAILKSFMWFLKWLNCFVPAGFVPGCSMHGCQCASAPTPPHRRADDVACGSGPRTAPTPR